MIRRNRPVAAPMEGGGDGANGALLEQPTATTPTRMLQGFRCNGDDYSGLINSFGYPPAILAGAEDEYDFVTVEYDFELAWEPSQPGERFPPSLLANLDYGLLDQVASDLYLRGCVSVADRQDFGGFTITGVADDVPTYRDLFVDECQYLRVDGARCVPVRGTMTASYIGTDPAAVRDALLSAISTVMSENRGTNRPVQQLLFLGDRATYGTRGGPSFAAAEGSDGDENALRTTAMATSASALFVILALMGVGLFVWRQRRTSEQKRELQSPPSDLEMPTDLSSPNSTMPDSEVATSPKKATLVALAGPEAEQSDLLVDLDDVAPDVVSDNSSTNAVTEPLEVEEATSQADNPPELARVQSSSSSSDGSLNGNPMFLSASSLPMVKSETLKKHRKKKRKSKKKVTLVRVNSRENVAGMETISETDEQEQQDDLDDDGRPSRNPSFSASDDDSSVYSAASSGNERDVDDTPPPSPKRTAGASPFRRRDLPPLPPAAF